jgi:predicted nucleic acid-binding protein
VLKVLDSWALMAWLEQQPASAKIESVLEQSAQGIVSLVMSWINVGEVYYTLVRRYGTPKAEQFRTRLPSLPFRRVLPNDEQIIAAARLKGTHAISYADAFAVALAQEQGAPLITGDPELKDMARLIQVEWIG